jgi:hypothetical protein
MSASENSTWILVADVMLSRLSPPLPFFKNVALPKQFEYIRGKGKRQAFAPL